MKDYPSESTLTACLIIIQHIRNTEAGLLHFLPRSALEQIITSSKSNHIQRELIDLNMNEVIDYLVNHLRVLAPQFEYYNGYDINWEDGIDISRGEFLQAVEDGYLIDPIHGNRDVYFVNNVVIYYVPIRGYF